jgi:hypothetical protein
MTRQTLTLEELKKRPLESVFQDVVEKDMAIIVQLPSGKAVSIEPKPTLKPLPELEGYIPDGWKDAIYNQG